MSYKQQQAIKVQKFVQDALVKKTQEISNLALKKGRKVLWLVLQEIKPLAEEKLRSLIRQEIYDKPLRPYYYRTGAFLQSANIKLTQGGGHYVMRISFDPNVLSAYHGDNTFKQGDFWSYSYTFGRKEGTELNNAEYQWLINTMLEEGIPTPYGLYAHNNIKDMFDYWLEHNFQPLMMEKFNLRFKKTPLVE